MAQRVLDAPWLESPLLLKVLSALGAPATDVRVVGGCVRDTVLGRPVTDIDLATPDLPTTVIDKLEAAGLKAVPTGIDHGTITAVAEGQGFEVTTLRKDTACDGRHAAVEFTQDWREDATRRDFTINAMSMRPNGEVFDFFDGWRDAEAGRITFIGEPVDRIQEDFLRILRFFRFLAHYGRVDPDAATVSACHVYRSRLAALSAHRIRNEMAKLLSARDPSAALLLMQETEVLTEVVPGETDAGAVARLIALEAHIRVEGNLQDQDSWFRRWCALVPDHNTDVADRFHMSKRDAASLQALHDASQAVPKLDEESAWRDFLYAHHHVAADAVLVAAARAQSINTDAVSGSHARCLEWRQPTFPVKGRDLQDLGFESGVALGQMLDQLEQQWLSSGFSETRDELLRTAATEKP